MDCPEFRILAKDMMASKYILNLRQPGMTFWNSCSIPLSPGSGSLRAIGQRLVTQSSCRNSVPKSWGTKADARGKERCQRERKVSLSHAELRHA